MPGDRTDAELVSAVAIGDDAAFADLVDRHGPWALSVARRYAPDSALAEDAVQESLIDLIDRSKRLVIGESVRPWLYVVIRNRALGQGRAARRTQTAPTPDTAVDPSPAHEADPAVRDAVEFLPEEQRETLILRVVDGLSVGETANALGIPEGTVKSRLHAALQTLRGHKGLRND